MRDSKQEEAMGLTKRQLYHLAQFADDLLFLLDGRAWATYEMPGVRPVTVARLEKDEVAIIEVVRHAYELKIQTQLVFRFTTFEGLRMAWPFVYVNQEQGVREIGPDTADDEIFYSEPLVSIGRSWMNRLRAQQFFDLHRVASVAGEQ